MNIPESRKLGDKTMTDEARAEASMDRRGLFGISINAAVFSFVLPLLNDPNISNTLCNYSNIMPLVFRR